MATAPTEGCPPEIRFVVDVNEGDGVDDRDWGGHAQRTHALAAVDEGTGRERGALEIIADDGGHMDALRWASGLR